MTKYLVFGHKNPDTDTIGAAIAFSYYLEKKGYQAEAVALGQVNDETAYALEYFNIEAPRIVETVSNEVERVALVDHNEPSQSVDDLNQVQVDFVVDHHRIANFETSFPLFYRAEPIGSTSSVLYKMFVENQIDIPMAIAGMMLSAIISDTLLFKSPTCTSEDKEIGFELAKIAEVNLEEYGIALLKAGADIASKSDLAIVEGDAKTFELNGSKVRIGQVNAVGFEELLERKEGLLQVMKSEMAEKGYDLFLFVMTDILVNDSIGLVVGDDVSPVEHAFQQTISEDQLTLPGVVSRKKQVVPPLTASYNQK